MRYGDAGDGIGALYQAPDGTIYQVQGLAEDDELRGLAEDEASQMMGIAYAGEVRQGPDGNLYQWVQGIDGLGNPVGFWKALRRIRRRLSRFARRTLPIARQFAPFIPGGAAVTAAIPIVQKALPIARQVAPLIPGGAAAMTAASPIVQQAEVAGYGGLGALYQAPDGTMYQVQGLAEDEELRGFAEDAELRGLDEDEELKGLEEDEELRGFAEDEELRGLEEDEELRGVNEDEELRGLAEEEELRRFAEDEELRGLGQGYVREPGASGLEAYVPQTPPQQTRWFTPPAQAPELWKPLW